MSFAGKTAIVTGGSRGLGAGAAIDLAKEGANVLIVYAKADDKAKAVQKEIRELNNGAKAEILKIDVTATDAPSAIISAALQHFGPKIHILIHSAGISRFNNLDSLTPEDFDQHMTINVRAPVFLTQAALPHLSTDGDGRIILLSSGAGKAGMPNTTAYAASKGAVEAIGRVWASELSAKKVTVNTLAPGPIDTDILEGTDKALVESVRAIGMIGTVKDVTGAIVFLCSEKGRWINGVTLALNRGLQIVA